MPKSRERVIARRIKELQNWSLKDLIAKRDELGLKMDPTQSYDMPSLIAEEEVRRIEDPVATTYKDWEIANPEDIRVAYKVDDRVVDTSAAEEAMARHINLNMGARVEISRPYDIQTSSGYFIYEVILPEVLRHFFSKNADYGDQHRTGLGIRAEFVGLHRKFAKLKAFFWDAKLMNHESGKEMLHDVIGQCLIMLDLMAQEEQQ